MRNWINAIHSQYIGRVLLFWNNKDPVWGVQLMNSQQGISLLLGPFHVHLYLHHWRRR